MDCPPCYLVQLGTDLFVRPDQVTMVYTTAGRVYVSTTSGALVTDWPISEVLDALDLHAMDTTNTPPEGQRK